MDPKHRFRPEKTLTFIHLSTFARVWDELGLSMIDLHEVEIAIMASPQLGRVIQGTRGLRKFRFVPSKWNMGKRGALRVCYVFFESHKVVLLTLVYPKSKQENMTQQEKSRINRAIEAIEKELER